MLTQTPLFLSLLAVVQATQDTCTKSHEQHQEAGTKLLLPLYVYPESDLWDNTYRAVAHNPSLTFQVILNVENGPGGPEPGSNSDWITAVTKLKKFPNVETLGYVYTAYTERPRDEILADISAWAGWNAYADADISLDGILFDQVPNAEAPDDAAGIAEYVAYMANLTAVARAAFCGDKAPKRNDGRLQIAFNPGTEVYEDAYFDIADLVIVYDEFASNYTVEEVLTVNVREGREAKSGILLHDFKTACLEADTLRSWLWGFLAKGVGSVNVVDYGYDAVNTTDKPADTESVARILANSQSYC